MLFMTIMMSQITTRNTPTPTILIVILDYRTKGGRPNLCRNLKGPKKDGGREEKGELLAK
jgi:hypothetical protein